MVVNRQKVTISTHASLAGRDSRRRESRRRESHFNPRVPCGTRPEVGIPNSNTEKFQPPRPWRDATMWSAGRARPAPISTHASLAGRDDLSSHALFLLLISTHASLAGRDHRRSHASTDRRYFNPRVPCGTRRAAAQIEDWYMYISTHASLAGRDQRRVAPRERLDGISTHASLAGRDPPPPRKMNNQRGFQPTRPLRDATSRFLAGKRTAGYFNPRVPCGTRQKEQQQ